MSTAAAAWTTLAFILAINLAYCLGWLARGRHDTARRTAVRAERAARPPGPHPVAVADEIALGWQALNEACCLRWWETSGADHDDPDRCTRKDHHA